MRLALGVMVGYLVMVGSTLAFFVLSGRDVHAAQPAAFMAASTVVGIIAALAAGYVAARIGGRQGLSASRVVAFMIAVGAAVSMATASGARWSQWAALLLMAPSAIVGGAMSQRRREA